MRNKIISTCIIEDIDNYDVFGSPTIVTITIDTFLGRANIHSSHATNPRILLSILATRKELRKDCFLGRVILRTDDPYDDRINFHGVFDHEEMIIGSEPICSIINGTTFEISNISFDEIIRIGKSLNRKDNYEKSPYDIKKELRKQFNFRYVKYEII